MQPAKKTIMFQHKEERFLPYTAEQLFLLVADVERYPQFLPWCLDVSILKRYENGFTARVEAEEA